MSRSVVCLLALVALLIPADMSLAKPPYSPTCINCHKSTSGKLTMLGTTGTLNLGDARLDGQNPGALKYYVVSKGKTLSITLKISNASKKYGADVYFPSVRGLRSSRNNKLRFTADPRWYVSGNPPYYLLSAYPIRWLEKSITYEFNMRVSQTTPCDVYEVNVNVGGKGTGLWAQQERIYIKVVP